MRVYCFVLSLLFTGSCLFGQPSREKDSLQNILSTATHDSTKIKALCRLSRIEQNNTRSYQYVNDAIALALKGNWPKGNAICYLTLGNFYGRSDYAKAMEYFFKSLRLSEEIWDTETIAAALFGVGNMYRLQENPTTALPYFFKVEPLYKSIHSPHLINNYNLIGIVYEKLGKTDSALYFFNRGYEIANPLTPIYTSRILRGLGRIHMAKNDIELALSFFRKSMAEAVLAENPEETCQTDIQLSRLFARTGKQDSALFYGNQAMQAANGMQSTEMIGEAAIQLADLYERTDTKEALRYYKLSAAMKDSIFGAESQAKVQNLTFSELERQREVNEAKRKEAEERKHNLQYAAIALGMVSFVILFFLLSYSVIASPKLIRFFGVVALLIFFEFLNLLLHPYLGQLTHHSPVLMLLIMVGVAALLVPLHHRLEHWVTNRMIAKNNRIRLAAAKKTIAQLEGIDKATKTQVEMEEEKGL